MLNFLKKRNSKEDIDSLAQRDSILVEIDMYVNYQGAIIIPGYKFAHIVHVDSKKQIRGQKIPNGVLLIASKPVFPTPKTKKMVRCGAAVKATMRFDKI